MVKKNKSYGYISIDQLIRIYKIINRDPNKVFIAGDFGNNYLCRKHINTLISLGLVEQVGAYLQRESKNGKIYTVRNTTTIGYILANRDKPKNIKETDESYLFEEKLKVSDKIINEYYKKSKEAVHSH
jgi:hypothetical protein